MRAARPKARRRSRRSTGATVSRTARPITSTTSSCRAPGPRTSARCTWAASRTGAAPGSAITCRWWWRLRARSGQRADDLAVRSVEHPGDLVDADAFLGEAQRAVAHRGDAGDIGGYAGGHDPRDQGAWRGGTDHQADQIGNGHVADADEKQDAE